MSITPAQLENTVREWIESVSGRTCIYEHGLGPQLPEAFCLVNLSIVNPFQWDVVKTSEDGLTEDVRGLAVVTLTISAIGDDADGKSSIFVVNELRNSIHASARWADLWGVMGKGEVGQISDISSEFRGKIRPRHEFTLSGQAVLGNQFTSDYFDKIAVTTNISGVVDTWEVGTDCPPPQLDQSGC